MLTCATGPVHLMGLSAVGQACVAMILNERSSQEPSYHPMTRQRTDTEFEARPRRAEPSDCKGAQGIQSSTRQEPAKQHKPQPRTCETYGLSFSLLFLLRVGLGSACRLSRHFRSLRPGHDSLARHEADRVSAYRTCLLRSRLGSAHELLHNGLTVPLVQGIQSLRAA